MTLRPLLIFCLIFTQTAQAYSLARLPYKYQRAEAKTPATTQEATQRDDDDDDDHQPPPTPEQQAEHHKIDLDKQLDHLATQPGQAWIGLDRPARQTGQRQIQRSQTRRRTLELQSGGINPGSRSGDRHRGNLCHRRDCR